MEHWKVMMESAPTLILENHGTEKLTLKQGTVVGTLTPVEEMGRWCGGVVVWWMGSC